MDVVIALLYNCVKLSTILGQENKSGIQCCPEAILKING